MPNCPIIESIASEHKTDAGGLVVDNVESGSEHETKKNNNATTSPSTVN